MLAVPSVNVPGPLFVSLTALAGLPDPSSTIVRLSLVGSTLAPSPVPVPLNAIVCIAPPAVDESLMFMVAVSVASSVAVKETKYVQEPGLAKGASTRAARNHREVFPVRAGERRRRKG